MTPPTRTRVAYLMSRFPKATETFIVREAEQMRGQGFDPVIFSLVEEHEGVIQPEARPFLTDARFGDRSLLRLLKDHLYWLRSNPRSLMTAWRRVLLGTMRSPRFFMRSLVVVPVAASFARQIRDEDFRWVHAHYATHPSTVAFVVKTLTGISYSMTAHAHDIYVDRAMLEQKVSSASFIATVSDFNRELLGSLYGNEILDKVHVVRCGVDPELFDASSSSTDHRAGELRIVSVGSLEPYKGHTHLVEACALLRVSGIEPTCTIIGEGPSRSELEERIEQLGLRAHITLAGRLDRSAVLESLHAADVFALASVETADGKMEGIPVALMEAMSVGLPVIGTSLSGIPELVVHEQTGLLVEPTNSHALAGALERLARDGSLRRKLGAGGRRLVLAQYDVAANAAKLGALIDSRVGVEAA